MKELNDKEYIEIITNFLTKDKYSNVFIKNKKYKTTSFEVPSYKYNAIDLILKYLEKKVDKVEHVYNYKGNYDYCTIFMYKLL